MLMLPMNINQPLARFTQGGEIHKLSIDPADTFALDTQLPPDNQMLIRSWR
ncbi:hypothetical protein D3C80_1936180 [compost metagenome]